MIYDLRPSVWRGGNDQFARLKEKACRGGEKSGRPPEPNSKPRVLAKGEEAPVSVESHRVSKVACEVADQSM